MQFIFKIRIIFLASFLFLLISISGCGKKESKRLKKSISDHAYSDLSIELTSTDNVSTKKIKWDIYSALSCPNVYGDETYVSDMIFHSYNARNNLIRILSDYDCNFSITELKINENTYIPINPHQMLTINKNKLKNYHHFGHYVNKYNQNKNSEIFISGKIDSDHNKILITILDLKENEFLNDDLEFNFTQKNSSCSQLEIKNNSKNSVTLHNISFIDDKLNMKISSNNCQSNNQLLSSFPNENFNEVILKNNLSYTVFIEYPNQNLNFLSSNLKITIDNTNYSF